MPRPVKPFADNCLPSRYVRHRTYQRSHVWHALVSSPRLTKTVLGERVATEVTLAIQIPFLSDRIRAGLVADRLAQLGAKSVSWTAESHDVPGRATFKFENEARCDAFLAVALDIPGVSLVLSD